MKNYIPTYEDFVNEDILNDPKAKLWDTKYRINYDDLPANMNLTTAYLNILFKGIPYQHYAFPQVSDDGNLIFKNQRDLDKAKKILSGKVKSVNEAKDFKATKDFEEFLEEIDGMPEHRIRRIMGNKYIDTPGGYRDEAEDYDNDIVEYMISNMGRKEFEKLKAYWETNIKESVVNEGDMTKFYDGFIVLDFKNKDMYKFKYIKGTKNSKVEVDAINKLVKSTGLSQANFTVHGFVKKGEWNSNDTPVFESAMGDVHIMAEEAKTFDEFKAEFIKEYGIGKKDNNKELHNWLQGIWKENHKK
jgi:hypothetical protein